MASKSGLHERWGGNWVALGGGGHALLDEWATDFGGGAVGSSRAELAWVYWGEARLCVWAAKFSCFAGCCWDAHFAHRHAHLGQRAASLGGTSAHGGVHRA